ncbi:hypothetical protein A6A04_15840 [Paramagnetospirillum marisnigri]|uniref:N-acetyltransferase domain-containing protein n=1 Tax=Paramagnetospirillum marisnigri TaxID=1285242 RepID=A0A178MUN3_9PROT|nr:GNAT family N-acetyltransferase [Paramagnetospirillum marisnigri]OAN52768.1 hypothetical protein A6A04_15840 [Paramagnetospirillum marisnigri]
MITITLQPFESAILGGAVHRLDLDGVPDASEIRAIAAHVRAAPGVALAWARIAEDDRAAAELLTQAGFVQVETLVTLVRPPAPAPKPAVAVGLASPADAGDCAAIGRAAFSFDRFHADTRLNPACADEIKARWVANGVAGRADAALVVRDSGQLAGFNLCMRREAEVVIDLIAVRPQSRGSGLGRALILGALAHYGAGETMVRVGTQAANTASLALYRSLGFVERQRAATFHLVP